MDNQSWRCKLGMLAGVLVILTVPSWAEPGRVFDEVFEQTYPLPFGGRFALGNVNGTVVVDGWEREEVEVRAVKTARNDPAELQRVQIAVDAQGDRVAIRTIYPKDDGIEVSVDYRVRVPYRVLLENVQTVNGAVRVRRVEGAGTLRTVNGNVELLDGAGLFSARTTNGNIRLDLRSLRAPVSVPREGPLTLEAINGSIVLALPAGAGAHLDVRSVNGDFHSELPIVVEGAMDARGLRGRLGGGGIEFRLRTVNGGIRVVTAQPSI